MKEEPRFNAEDLTPQQAEEMLALEKSELRLLKIKGYFSNSCLAAVIGALLLIQDPIIKLTTISGAIIVRILAELLCLDPSRAYLNKRKKLILEQIKNRSQ